MCRWQEYSNWNFARMLLNGYSFHCPSEDDAKCGKQLKFWKGLTRWGDPSKRSI